MAIFHAPDVASQSRLKMRPKTPTPLSTLRSMAIACKNSQFNVTNAEAKYDWSVSFHNETAYLRSMINSVLLLVSKPVRQLVVLSESFINRITSIYET
jgi:hypothetical protein